MHVPNYMWVISRNIGSLYLAAPSRKRGRCVRRDSKDYKVAAFGFVSGLFHPISLKERSNTRARARKLRLFYRDASNDFVGCSTFHPWISLRIIVNASIAFCKLWENMLFFGGFMSFYQFTFTSNINDCMNTTGCLTRRSSPRRMRASAILRWTSTDVH